jgi:hypothetical protein
MRVRSPDAAQWLHGLDSYTNAEFGRARTLSGSESMCVACSREAGTTDASGLCPTCVTQRQPDTTTIVLFRSAKSPGHAAVIFALNTIRIGTFGRSAALPKWFQALHLHFPLWPALVAIAICAFLLTWFRVADRRISSA